MVSVAVVFVSDRGEMYLPECRRSLEAALDGGPPVDAWHVVDDREHRLGMAGAVRSGFEWALDQNVDHVLWVEEDFVFTAPVDLAGMAWILERGPYAQVVLKRQPWSPVEQLAGGIIETAPAEYRERWSTRKLRWVEHERIFSLNPCLIPRDVLALGWPDGNEAEFTTMCLDKGLRFAFYGAAADPPRVLHVGAVRGTGWRL